MTSTEIDMAIQRAFDGALTEAECVALRSILKSDPSARALYCEHAGLHQALIYRLSRGTAAHKAKPVVAARRKRDTHGRSRMLMIAAAAFALCAGLVLKLHSMRSVATYQGTLGSRFTIGNSADAMVGSISGKLGKGATVNLIQGSLEVVTRDGARGIVLAPAVITLQSANRISLERGNAWFRVEKRARGFQVATPRMVVTDFGTEFGIVSKGDAGAEVHVFSGQVESGGIHSPQAEVRLTSGQARSCDESGHFSEIAMRPGDFLTDLPSQSTGGLIANGDFEAGNQPGDHQYGLNATPALLPSWSYGQRISVALRDNSGRIGYGEDGAVIVSPTADVQIGFQDDTVGKPAADDVSIRQSFSTVPGTRYVVEFGMGAFFFRRDNSLEITASVQDGTDSTTGRLLGQTVDRRSYTEGTGYNRPASFTFTAESSTTTLVFTETSANTDDADPVIDNISVKAAK